MAQVALRYFAQMGNCRIERLSDAPSQQDSTEDGEPGRNRTSAISANQIDAASSLLVFSDIGRFRKLKLFGLPCLRAQ